MKPIEIKARLTSVFQATFDDPTITLSDMMTAADIPRWDSLSHINLILGVEKAFGVRFTTREVRALKSVGELISLIARKCPE